MDINYHVIIIDFSLMFIHALFDNLQFISHSYFPFQRLFVLLLRKNESKGEAL